MKHKVSDLEGTLLDAAVAKADGKVMGPAPRDGWFEHIPLSMEDPRFYTPSRRWEYGGPIITRERISLQSMLRPDRDWIATMEHPTRTITDPENRKPMATYVIQSGPTPLVAAMRAFVASKLGEEVELP